MSELGIPLELLHMILGFLDLESIKSLRLVNRILSQRCLGPHFNIRQPTLDLTEQSFQSLKALIDNPVLRQQVHHITVVALYFATKEAEEKRNPDRKRQLKWKTQDIQSDIHWLREQSKIQEEVSAQSLVRRLGRVFQQFENLDSVELDAAVQLGPQLRVSSEEGVWPEIWTKATKVHDIVISALAEGKVSIGCLSIYRDLIRCSVFLTDHTLQLTNLDQAGRDVLGAKLHTLKLSLCTEMSNETMIGMALGGDKIFDKSFGSETELPRRRIPQAASCERPGILQLLQSTPKLRHLDLQLYRMTRRDGGYEWISTAISEQPSLPELETLSLAGFPVMQDALLGFLARHTNTIKSVTFESITLTTGKWEPIFEQLSTKMPCLSQAHFSTLFDYNGVQGSGERPRRLINLLTIWENGLPKAGPFPPGRRDCFPHLGNSYTVHRRTFNEDQLRKGLEFRPQPQERSKGSPDNYLWGNRIRNVYGPPDRLLMCPSQPDMTDSSEYETDSSEDDS
ncbi:uncharacterized protein LDX57_010470 [Aspergillus melleus]|uniref:uncharacterized protein n=1 Tax=Aspergillus melleus TaxID=138277 RepID=UPI001E8E6247|nr:uncharacterized protein LDX57_010470 [Aspergillus melleus]KAH8432840.1 hypothetical protein LDX57_010470 [Aspergillus melleus]